MIPAFTQPWKRPLDLKGCADAAGPRWAILRYGEEDTLRYFNLDQILAGARSALKPALLSTMALTIIVAIVIYGFFSMLGAGVGAILLRFIGGVSCLLWSLFGLSALAHQVHTDLQGQPIPGLKEAMRFAYSRIRPLLLLPAWAVGGLLVLLLLELFLLFLARIPGLGLVWLALLGVPLLLLNTVIAIALLLALFNIAARVAISAPDPTALREVLWRLLRRRLPELLIYNLGGVLATALVAMLVLSPLWLGMQITWGLAHAVAAAQVAALEAAAGFWGGFAHLLALIVFGALLAAVASVPGIVITHMTLLVHLELDEPQAEKIAKKSAAATAKKSSVGRSRGGKKSTPRARKDSGGKATETKST